MALVLLITSLSTIIDIFCEKCITLKDRFGKACDNLNLFSLLNLPQLLYIFLLIFVYRFRSKINCICIRSVMLCLEWPDRLRRPLVVGHARHQCWAHRTSKGLCDHADISEVWCKVIFQTDGFYFNSNKNNSA